MSLFEFNDAEKLLLSLGIDNPSEIDLHVIAQSLGLDVRYAKLKSCDARLVGAGDRGIITVRIDANKHRKRFSIAHEIGHWIYHRHKALLCKASSIDETASQASQSREKKANDFASNLVMPRYLFDPLVPGIKSANFNSIREIANLFDVSVTVAARRVVETGRFPAILVYYRRTGRGWFCSSPTLSKKLHPNFEIHADAGVLSVMFKEVEGLPPMKRPASHFFDIREASGAFVREEIFRSHDDGVLSLLTIDDRILLGLP
ncbi:MAG: ImmA/IrrE family metallo-endopeptidase [Caulobacteraceae bacterium]|nr:ImmA/IrrE family metallo-endopeptidase [Caulobacteraceae bacterium]